MAHVKTAVSIEEYLVVQNDFFNRSGIGTVVVCGLTSNLRRARELGNVLLAP